MMSQICAPHCIPHVLSWRAARRITSTTLLCSHAVARAGGLLRGCWLQELESLDELGLPDRPNAYFPVRMGREKDFLGLQVDQLLHAIRTHVRIVFRKDKLLRPFVLRVFALRAVLWCRRAGSACSAATSHRILIRATRTWHTNRTSGVCGVLAGTASRACTCSGTTTRSFSLCVVSSEGCCHRCCITVLAHSGCIVLTRLLLPCGLRVLAALL
mmetsp:Transcript_23075/g.42000  ORF Transcript_23075/g.42000 Transcript_23075/m.42000 type:complete len:214 (-) Transcript_23075:2005-2646(-)